MAHRGPRWPHLHKLSALTQFVALLVLVDVVKLLVLVGPGMVALVLLVLLVLVPAPLLLMVVVMVLLLLLLPLTKLARRPTLPTHASLTGHGNNDIVPLSALQ